MPQRASLAYERDTDAVWDPDFGKGLAVFDDPGHGDGVRPAPPAIEHDRFESTVISPTEEAAARGAKRKRSQADAAWAWLLGREACVVPPHVSVIEGGHSDRGL